MKTIVCDAGPIIHLYEAHCLQLLRQTGSLYLPQRVFNEVQTTLQIKEPWPEWLQIISLSPLLFRKRAFQQMLKSIIIPMLGAGTTKHENPPLTPLW